MAADKENGNHKTVLSDYSSKLDKDAKERYVQKLFYNSGTRSLPDPFSLGGIWSSNPGTWPDLTFGDIYQYLIDTPSIYTKESMKAYKSLDAYKYVVSGHVQVILTNAVDKDCPYLAVKTKVTPSQRARDKPHNTWVYLHKKSGAVYCAHCTCMAGLGEVCSHVGALLFKIEMGVRIGITETSSTSKACQWNNTFRKDVAPATITDIFQQIKGARKTDIVTTQATGCSQLPSELVLKELYALVPDAAFFTSVQIQSSAGQIRGRNTCIPDYPRLLTSFIDTEIDNDNFEEKTMNLFQNYSVSDEQSLKLEKATRNQAVSKLWYQHRQGRVTASKAHDVLIRQEKTKPDNLVKKIMGYTTYNLSKKKEVRWGIEHEDECREQYVAYQKQAHLEFTYRDSGFVVNKKHPFLGASPDGMVSCKCCGKGTLEIKCPYKFKDKTVNEAISEDSQFCLDKNLHLKTNHKYYSQIQLQMYLTETQYCDFVVYTKSKPHPSMVIVKVLLDIAFCEHLTLKCENFIKKYVVREMISRTLENEFCSAEVEVVSESVNEEETWCICSEPEYGRMIQCDNRQCPYQWFHYKCVNIRRKPKGKWLCFSCEGI